MIKDVKEADRAAHTILFSEAAASLEIYARENPDDISKEVLDNICLGMTIPATRYIQAQRIRSKLINYHKKIFNKIDFLIVPATTIDAPFVMSKKVRISLQSKKLYDIRFALTKYTRYFNLAGNPVLTLPCGFSSKKLPIGIQIIGKPFSDFKLLQIGDIFQKYYPQKPLTPTLHS